MRETTRARRGWTLAACVAAAVVLVVATAAATTQAVVRAGAPRATASAAPVDVAGFPSGGADPGIFTDRCAVTKEAANDPIMMPGMTGASMQHEFFGNTATVASTTARQLVGGQSACTTSADASAYWLPVLYQNGAALTPSTALIYWRAPAATAASVSAMPAGITMIAGDEGATAPQSARIIDWTCTTGADDRPQPASDAPHDCAPGHELRLVITFPDCWDGHTLDGKPRTNVVYAGAGGRCPASHPVQIPQIVFHVSYPTRSGEGITLSTSPETQGPPVTGHADFMNGWTQSRMDADTAACIDTQTRCGPVVGAAAVPLGGKDPRRG